MNLILGEEILPCCTTVTTSTICELKYGERPRMVVHFKDKDPETGETTKNIPLDESFERSSCREQISTFVHKKGSLFKKVELFWPHDLLQVSNKSNRTEWSLILSVIILRDHPICLLTNISTDRIGGYRDIPGVFCQKLKKKRTTTKTKLSYYTAPINAETQSRQLIVS